MRCQNERAPSACRARSRHGGMSKWMAADALRLIDRDYACLTQSDVPVLPPQNVKGDLLSDGTHIQESCASGLRSVVRRGDVRRGDVRSSSISRVGHSCVCCCACSHALHRGDFPSTTSALGLMSAGTLSGLALSAVVASADMLSARELSDLALSAEAVSAGSHSLMGFSTRHCLWWQ